MFQSIFGRVEQTATARQQRQQQTIPQLDAGQVWERVQEDDNVLLVDVRTPGEYQLEHIPGSRLLPLSLLHQRSDELPKDRPIVCVCRSGARSQSAAELLAELGFADVSNLSGGMIGWKRAGLPHN
jgi:rhodanese-related sulfurtransferase